MSAHDDVDPNLEERTMAAEETAPAAEADIAPESTDNVDATAESASVPTPEEPSGITDNTSRVEDAGVTTTKEEATEEGEVEEVSPPAEEDAAPVLAAAKEEKAQAATDEPKTNETGIEEANEEAPSKAMSSAKEDLTKPTVEEGIGKPPGKQPLRVALPSEPNPAEENDMIGLKPNSGNGREALPQPLTTESSTQGSDVMRGTETPMAVARPVSMTEVEDEVRQQVLSRPVAVADPARPEESTIDDDKKEEVQSAHKRRWVFLGILAVVIVVIVVVVAVVAPKNKSDTATDVLTAQDEQLLGMLQQEQTSLYENGEDPLSNTTSPQYRAFLSVRSEFMGNVTDALLERYALSTLYYSTRGGSWTDNTNWLTSASVCLWYNRRGGTACDDKGYLTGLDLSNNGLEGPLPAEVAYLSKLVSLDLSLNEFASIIPEAYYQYMIDLVDLNLAESNITGTLSSGIGKLTALSQLSLDSNAITGPFPDNIGQLSNLKILSVRLTEMSGQLPTTLGMMSSLVELRTRLARWTGTLPTEIGMCSNLEVLEIGGAQRMYGELPDEFFSLTKLTWVAFTLNGFQGTISSKIGQLTRLNRLDLGRNRFYGQLPDEIGLLTELQQLRLNEQFLSGTMPSTLGALTSLDFFIIMNNNISGPLPESVGNMTALANFRFYNNSMTGALPNSLGALTAMENFGAHYNLFTGSINYDLFANWSSLGSLLLHNNFFTGELPDEQIWSLPNLIEIGLGSNLTGSIPESIGLASNLLILYLEDNELTGAVPSVLGTLTAMEELALNGNLLTSLPMELGQLTSLVKFHGQGNLFEGTIPDSLAGWTQSIALAMFEDNAFTGRMPLCDGTPLNGTEIYADCSAVECDCCTYCCDASGCVYVGGDPNHVEVDTRVGVRNIDFSTLDPLPPGVPCYTCD